MSSGESNPDFDCTVLVSRRLRHYAEDNDMAISVNKQAIFEVVVDPMQGDELRPTQVLFQLSPRISILRGAFEPAEHLTDQRDRITVNISRHGITSGNDIEVSKTLAHEAQHAADYGQLGPDKYRSKGKALSIAAALMIYGAWEAGVIYASEHRDYSSQEQVQKYSFIGFETTLGVVLSTLGGYALNPLEIRARRYAHKQPKRKVIAADSIMQDDDIKVVEYVIPGLQNRGSL